MISQGSRGPSVRSRFYERVIVKTSRCVPSNIIIEHHCPLCSLPEERRFNLVGPVPNYAIAKWWSHPLICTMFLICTSQTSQQTLYPASLIICFPLALHMAGTVITQSKSVASRCISDALSCLISSSFRYFRI